MGDDVTDRLNEGYVSHYCASAIVSAVVDALAPLGIHHIDMPLTSEKIWRAIHKR